MPLATRHRDDPAPLLPPLPALVVRRERGAAAMAALQGKAEEEMRRRFAAGHRAWVASLDGAPAAWGWVATRTAEIGELGSAFRVPRGERYLWNFVTRPSHRGMGIYPRLVDAIVRAESAEAERFWIARAPENHASGAGIRRAGFVTVAELSFDADGRPAVHGTVEGGGALAARLLGVPEAAESLARCWRCVRAGRGAMSCAAGACRCDYQRPASGCAA
jgi:ribosomal protein S18 acetylase RimI-like enzyme